MLKHYLLNCGDSLCVSRAQCNLIWATVLICHNSHENLKETQGLVLIIKTHGTLFLRTFNSSDLVVFKLYFCSWSPVQGPQCVGGSMEGLGSL